MNEVMERQKVKARMSREIPEAEIKLCPDEPVEPEAPAKMSVDEQIEAVKKLKELLDAGALTQDEFETKKKEIMGL